MKQKIAIIGGSGDLGSGIAKRLLKADYSIIIGSRSKSRAADAALEIADNSSARTTNVVGRDNPTAAREGNIVFLCVPFANQLATLDEIKEAVEGKLLVDTTVPLVPPKVARVQLPAEHSAAERAQQHLGAHTEVVSALHNVAAAHLAASETIDCDVLVFGDKRKSRQVVINLITDMGLNALHGGSLANSAAAEALTSVLIFMNRHYDAPGAGIRITRLPKS